MSLSISKSQKSNDFSGLFWAAWGGLIGLVSGIVSGAFFYSLDRQLYDLYAVSLFAIYAIMGILALILIVYAPWKS